MHVDEVDTDAQLVRRLLAAQFPQWAGLPLERLQSSGTDNALYRLGADKVVRLPRIQAAAGQVDKENRWLPRLAPLVSLPIPVPLARGTPGEGFPWSWSVYRWIEGESATIERIADLRQAAIEMAAFITALHGIDGRGMRYTCLEWAARLDPRRPATRKLLIQGGRLTAVIDFGCLGVGDPACDLIVAWNLFNAESREALRAALKVDEATWERGRGWALSVALIALPYYEHTNPTLAAVSRYAVREVLADSRLSV